jgi:hypothetical protein
VNAFAPGLLAEGDIEVHEQVVRPQVQRADLAQALDRGVGRDEGAHLVQHPRLDALADEQALRLPREQGGDGHEDESDDDRRASVEQWVLEQVAEEDAEERDDQPEHRRQVLEHDGEQARVLAGSDELERGHLPTRAVELAHGREERPALHRECDGQHYVVRRRVLKRRRVLERRDALVHGHPAADAEDRDRHDERPEVERLAVTERVLGVRRLRAPAHAEKDQAAVAGVDERVDTFRDHGRTAREPGRDELDGRDQQIPHDRRDDRDLRPACARHVTLRLRRTSRARRAQPAG